MPVFPPYRFGAHRHAQRMARNEAAQTAPAVCVVQKRARNHCPTICNVCVGVSVAIHPNNIAPSRIEGNNNGDTPLM
eukprot:1424485-Alexandrium_andersonii.AAC.1